MENTTNFAESQQAIQEIVSQLQQIDDQLAKLSASLPEPTTQFDARAELRVIVACVRVKSLAETIEALMKTTTLEQLRLRFDVRQYLGQKGVE